MDENDNIKEPKPWAWWLAATAICLAIWFGGYIFTKWLSGCSCIFQVDGELHLLLYSETVSEG